MRGRGHWHIGFNARFFLAIAAAGSVGAGTGCSGTVGGAGGGGVTTATGAGGRGGNGSGGGSGGSGGAGTGGSGVGGQSGTPGAVWIPAAASSWQWQLTGTIDQTVVAQLFDVDLFDTSVTTVASLHALGHKVVCYVSAGSYEDWRPDAAQFPTAVKGKPLDGWPGEQWLDVRQWTVLRPLIEARICAGARDSTASSSTTSTAIRMTPASHWWRAISLLSIARWPRRPTRAVCQSG